MKVFTLNHLKENLGVTNLVEIAARWTLSGERVELSDAVKSYMVDCGIEESKMHQFITNSINSASIRNWCIYNRGYDPFYAGKCCPTCGQLVTVAA